MFFYMHVSIYNDLCLLNETTYWYVFNMLNAFFFTEMSTLFFENLTTYCKRIYLNTSANSNENTMDINISWLIFLI